MKLTLNAGKVYAEKMSEVVDKVNTGLGILKAQIDENTPEDTLKLIKNNVITPAVMVGDRVIGSVSNDTPYALNVEYWFTTENKAFNYHKRGGGWRYVFYRGVGARMFTRAYDFLKGRLLSLIQG